MRCLLWVHRVLCKSYRFIPILNERISGRINFFLQQEVVDHIKPKLWWFKPPFVCGSLMINHRKPSKTIKNLSKIYSNHLKSHVCLLILLWFPRVFSSHLKIPRLDNISAPDITACGIDLNPARLRLLCKNLSENTRHGCKMGIEKAGFDFWMILVDFEWISADLCVVDIVYMKSG